MLRRLSGFAILIASTLVAPTIPSDSTGLQAAEKRKIVFVAGRASHGYGAHEHYAGCLLLEKCLKATMPEYETVVYKNGWPKDPKAFDGADAVVIYADGGGRHPANPHLGPFDDIMQRGVGLVCIHYAVETPKGEPGNRFLNWIGGYFEANWSVNPHWTADFKQFPKHEITNGVKPFAVNDEWYYHMRFREGMEHVTPILTDLPPKDSLRRKDGAHSGNPHVRAAVLERKEPQHVAWAATRTDGGRGFGFTGGHFHWNWGDPNFRRLVLNAIVWSAKGEIPAKGVAETKITLEDLEANQDFPQPRNFDRETVRKRFKLPPSAPTDQKPPKSSSNAKPLFSSPIVTRKTPGHAVNIEIDIRNAKQLFLVITDGGNGYGCDWANWAEPRLIAADGAETKLTDLKWKRATTDWGHVQVNKNAAGQPMRIAGKSVDYGIGAHANSVIAFELPKDFIKFKARGGLDNGGTDQSGCGGIASAQFHVYSKQPPRLVASPTSNTTDKQSRDPANAISQLEVHPGLNATLFASEPMIGSVSNIEVDHRGRVWVCEIMNYRGEKNRRPKGDRILILEDTDGDGKADRTKVFYQGRDIDSPHGICVLSEPNSKATRVIVSAGDKVQIITDSDGDDRPDKKELLFTGISGSQHDHGIHAFVFGPDGKLYFNFGNNGKQIKSAEGKLIVDAAGVEVREHRKPYQQGMVFRCNLDGSDFETLGWNFRNNWMVTVDSFGTIWQSDNDDDGNRGVRINYVMEFGNYGYRDEFTGAGWKTSRTGMASDIPTRHWYQNDPGVVPNLLQTGAGSPTGITVYEGDLLPKVFHGQVIHCDAGPNVCRAYPVKKSGAGYEAEIVNVLYGSNDKWFRPSDVTVAPDGSLFIADWYDPGVGGHRAGDLDSGRIFRIAPPGHKYHSPTYDYASPQGAVQALLNPNYAVRYMAWTALHQMGRKAEPALRAVFDRSEYPRYRARALWLLANLPDRSTQYIDLAITDSDADIRIVGLRVARQLDIGLIPIIAKLVDDKSAQVRRECAIALRHDKSPRAANLWSQLAKGYDGVDRWYLEALGIAADGQWDRFLDAWLSTAPNRASAATMDIIWRSRAKITPNLLADIISRNKNEPESLPRYFRAFDFQSEDTRNAALIQLAFSDHGEGPAAALISTESIKRLKGFDLKDQKASLEKVLNRLNGSPQFVSLVDKFNVDSRYPQLLAMAQSEPDSQVGVDAIRVLLSKRQLKMVEQSLRGTDIKKAAATARALGNSASSSVDGLLLSIVVDDGLDLELRRQATRGLAMTTGGGRSLILLAKTDKLSAPLMNSAAFPLSASPVAEIRSAAATIFPLPSTKSDKEIPPISQLLKMRGNAERGAAVFEKAGECAQCHKVNGSGKDVGPDLSGIGAKLSRQALLESILFPSAGISHNFETYLVQTVDGNVVTGIIQSQTDDAVVLKLKDDISRTFPRSQIEQMKKSDVSMMPADLQKIITTQELVDIVDYLLTLKAGNEK